MYRGISRGLGRTCFYGCNSTSESNEVLEIGIVSLAQKRVLQRNNIKKETSSKLINKVKKPTRLKTILFHSNGLQLPSYDDTFWMHKRWSTGSGGCPGPVRGPTKACDLKAVELGKEPDILDPNIPQPRVIIVGAGMAGLSAASRLSQAGFTNFELIEATDRLGGRIHSCWVGDVVADLGPLWLNRATISNPLYALAAQEGLLKSPMAWRRKPPLRSTNFLARDGRAIEPRVVLPAVQLFQRVVNQANELFGLETGRSQGSLGSFMSRRVAEESKAVPDDWKEDALRVFWGLANEFKTRYGARADKLSSDMLGSQINLPGGSVRVPLGLLGVVGPLLKKVDQKCIRLSNPVVSVCWSSGQPSRAVVKLAGGDLLSADYVLVTLSLGVLRAKASKMFTPCLPEEKRHALRRLGWATTNRFILSYERPFWLPGEGFYRFLWTKEELENKSSWIKGLSVIEEIPGAPNLLTFVLGDDEAAMTEGCADDSIAEEVTKALRLFSGDASLPYPKGLVRSKWGSDPQTLGSTSYLAEGSTSADHCALGRPMPPDRPVILFAGEATAPGHAATLLGAHLSGVREADRILQLTRIHAGPPPITPKIP